MISVESRTPGNLDADEWRKSSSPEGAEALPSDIVPAIEETVRSYFAKPVESTS
jgi:hypothetical protein